MKGQIYRDASHTPSQQMWLVTGQRPGMVEVMSLDGTGTERDIDIDSFEQQISERILIPFSLVWERNLQPWAQYDFSPRLEERSS